MVVPSIDTSSTTVRAVLPYREVSTAEMVGRVRSTDGTACMLEVDIDPGESKYAPLIISFGY